MAIAGCHSSGILQAGQIGLLIWLQRDSSCCMCTLKRFAKHYLVNHVDRRSSPYMFAFVDVFKHRQQVCVAPMVSNGQFCKELQFTLFSRGTGVKPQITMWFRPKLLHIQLVDAVGKATRIRPERQSAGEGIKWSGDLGSGGLILHSLIQDSAMPLMPWDYQQIFCGQTCRCRFLRLQQIASITTQIST